MNADICARVPWHCGNSDGCEQGWHLASYWIQDDAREPYTLDNYSDRDHDPVDELPTPEEESEAWEQYRQHVAETGEDPLCEYLVDRVLVKRQTWQVVFKDAVGGCLFAMCRRNGRGNWTKPCEAPRELLDYLLVEKRSPRGRLWFFPEGMERLKQCVADEGLKVYRDRYALKFNVQIEVTTDRNPETVRRELIALARKGGAA